MLYIIKSQYLILYLEYLADIEKIVMQYYQNMCMLKKEMTDNIDYTINEKFSKLFPN